MVRASEDTTKEPPSASGLSRFRALLAQGLVIVLSVLFALAVDRLVKRFDDRALEQSYLRGLLADFQFIESNTEYAKNSAAQRDSAAALVLATLKRNAPRQLTGLELARALEMAGWVIDIRFTRDTWNDLVGTGHLSVLRNAELRRQIATFYQQTDQLYVFTRDWVQMARDFSNATRNILEPELRVAIGSEFIFREPVAEALAPRPEEIIRRVQGQPALLSTIGDVLLINKVSARMYAGLDASARNIREMISDELKESLNR